jgi:hypothetical protein
MYSFEAFKRASSTAAKDLGLTLFEGNHSDNDDFPYDRFIIHVRRRRRLGSIQLPINKRVLVVEGKLDHHERTVEESSYKPENPEEIGKRYLREVDEILNAQPLLK